MKTYLKRELLQLAAPYFKQGEKVIYATSDGNFFYEAHKHHAFNHKTTSKTELHELTKIEFDSLGKAEPSELEKAEKVLAKAKSYMEERKTDEAKAKALTKVNEAQAEVDKLKAEN